MNFDPEEWLKVAEVCCGHIPDVDREALLRTALNRAYYAALMSLKARIEAVQGHDAIPGWRTHEAITQAVRTAGANFADIAELLKVLRLLRERADYVLSGEALDWQLVHRRVRDARWLIRNRIKALPEAEVRRLRVPRS